MILLYEAGITQAVHLSPVCIKWLLLLCSWIHQVLNEIFKGWNQSLCVSLFNCLWWICVVSIETQNIPYKCGIKIGIPVPNFVNVGRNDSYKWMTDKHELGVVLQFCL